MKKPNLSLEKSYSGIVAGVDEAGCGPWAGPVVAAAVILNRKAIPKGINDSKKIPIPMREELYHAILASSQCGIGSSSVDEIDTLNILAASKLAMVRAMEALATLVDVALIDGNRPPVLSCKTHSVICGDEKSLSIAAASILAKVTRDRIMKQLAAEHPGYGWETNAGYGTKCHQQSLVTLGVTLHHRKSFRPIRNLLNGRDMFADEEAAA